MQLFGEFAGTQFTHGTGGRARLVDEQGFSVKHVCSGCNHGGHPFHGVGRMKVIAAVEELDKIAGSHAQAFVHGIVQSTVFFRNPAQVGHFCGKILYNFDRIVFGSAIHHDVLNVWIRLIQHTLHGAGQQRFAVVHDGDNGKYRRLLLVQNGNPLLLLMAKL